jgi:Amt family ammonium transporter
MINTFVCTAAAALAWMSAEWLEKGKPSLLGLASGAIAGLVAITPAAGFSGPMGAIVLGLVAGVVCLIACTVVKNALGYDDSLDVFGVHGVGGIIGAIGTGVVAAPWLGGAGIVDYAVKPGEATAAAYDLMAQVMTQSKAVAFTIVFSGVASFILFKVVDAVVGLRPEEQAEREGLDITQHGERAYNT